LAKGAWVCIECVPAGLPPRQLDKEVCLLGWNLHRTCICCALGSQAGN